jgi:hypothetical protein
MNRIKDLTELIDTRKGDIAYIIAHGPSLRKHQDKIKINNKNNIIISCNDVDTITEFEPNYWVFANSIQTVEVMKERFKKFPNSVIVHADSVDSTPRNWIEENITNEYVGYDQRHFENKKCSNCYNGCANLVKDRKTIQEILIDYSGYNKRYSTGHTVAIHMFSLAVLLGCKKIYLFGIDLDYSLGYVDGKSQPSNPSEFGPWLPEILTDFEKVYESAKIKNVEVFNMSDISPLKNIIPTINELP